MKVFPCLTLLSLVSALPWTRRTADLAPRSLGQDVNNHTGSILSRRQDPPSDVGSDADIAAALQAHNDARAQYGYAPLTWNPDLAANAATAAQYDAANYLLTDDAPPDNDDGRNTYQGWASNSDDFTSATNAWVNERSMYTAGAGYSDATGHFTQVVWPDTTQVGMGFAWSPDGQQVYIIARYQPAGNVIGSVAIPADVAV